MKTVKFKGITGNIYDGEIIKTFERKGVTFHIVELYNDETMLIRSTDIIEAITEDVKPFNREQHIEDKMLYCETAAEAVEMSYNAYSEEDEDRDRKDSEDEAERQSIEEEARELERSLCDICGDELFNDRCDNCDENSSPLGEEIQAKCGKYEFDQEGPFNE